MALKKNRRVYIDIPCIHRSVMAKLYWRVKKNGKWTWTPYVCGHCGDVPKEVVCDECCYINSKEEEE